MIEVDLNGRTVEMRPLTVGDLRVLGDAWPAALMMVERFLRSDLPQQGRMFPEMVSVLAPCLCRMTGLASEELDGLPMPACITLLKAFCEVLLPPFPKGSH